MRLHPDFGPRLIRTSQGNSSYHAMQWRLERRFSRGLQMTASYTWSRNIDITSEGIGMMAGQSELVAPSEDRLSRGPSDYDRSHRFTILYIWSVPGPAGRFWKYPFGGWSMAGITSFQSGAPFTVVSTRGVADVPNRPDIGNPNAPLNSRAVLSRSCTSGYLNPDMGLC